jgi:prepilin-type N-terminal cleavage/methylation domain-containing protein
MKYITKHEERRAIGMAKEKSILVHISDHLAHSLTRPLRAFTLIEMMVSVTIFAIVMMIGVGALLSLVETNKRAEAIHQVMSSLSAALESMSRTIRVGSSYHCETNVSPTPTLEALSTPKDCDQNIGGLLLAVESQYGSKLNLNDQVVFRLQGGKLERSLEAGHDTSWVDLTSPEVTIDSFRFYVLGTAPNDGLQPRAIITIKGTIQLPKGPTTFLVQTTVVQRLIDI